MAYTSYGEAQDATEAPNENYRYGSGMLLGPDTYTKQRDALERAQSQMPPNQTNIEGRLQQTLELISHCHGVLDDLTDGPKPEAVSAVLTPSVHGVDMLASLSEEGARSLRNRLVELKKRIGTL